ncbi:MAG: Hsp20/alpha crystallin family protein [Proteobacteria bacterium]|nr:Hsp20/alpha crystallin family protein [Pseudomonadota bacterium]
MALVPWKPFDEFTTFRREMDRLWDRFFSERPALDMLEKGWEPTMDITETKSDLIVKAELPGIDPKEIDISLTGDTLTIKGEKQQEKEEKEENYYRIERSYGIFSRTIKLPMSVQNDRIKASYQHGVLKITLPKSEEAKQKQIKIKVE